MLVRREHAGHHVTLGPLDADRHATALHAAGHDGGDPRLWDWLPYGPFADTAAFTVWAREAQRSDDPLFFALVPRGTGTPSGVLSLMRFDPENPTVEIGHVWFGAEVQRSPAATEAVFLLARHAFEDLGVRRLEWKCDARNERSQAAARRFGFTYEGTFRQHARVKGRNRDTAWFALLDGEWPAVRDAFAAWLEPGNFDADGRQRTRLAARR